jgi:hypothetical protein
MAVTHDAQDVAEGVDDRSGDEPVAALGERLELLGTQRDKPVQGCGHVVDVPVDDRPARAYGKPGRGEPPSCTSGSPPAGRRPTGSGC